MKISQEEQSSLAAGAVELVTVEEAKEWSVIETDLDDSIVEALIVSAREIVEAFISKDMISKNRIQFEECPEYDGEKYMVILDYASVDGTVNIDADGTTLVEGTDFDFVGLGNRYIKLYSNQVNMTITYESKPIVSASEITLAKAATKVLVEQIYDNRANLEGDSDIVIMDDNVKSLLSPIRMMYF